MRKIAGKISVLLAAILAVGSLTGCGSSKIGDYASTVVATYGSESIYLDEANFWLRYNQWIDESYYWTMYTYFGYDNMWEVPTGDGDETMADGVHEEVMSQILQTRILLDHATDYGIELTEAQKTKVSDTIKTFLEENPGFTKYSDASQDKMIEWMEKNAVANLVIQAVKDAAEITVTDEECQKYSVEYIQVTPETEEETSEAEETEAEEDATQATETDAAEAVDEGRADETTEAAETTAAEETTEAAEETPKGEELANQVLAMANEGSEFTDIESALGVTSSTASYLLTGETDTSVLYTTSSEMSAGEVKMVDDGSDGWYIIKKTNDLDEEATEEERESLTETKEAEAFEGVYAEWAKAAPKFKVKEKIWSQITITDKIYEDPTETSEAEETIADEETSAVEETGEAETAAEESSASAETSAAEITGAETTETVETTSEAE